MTDKDLTLDEMLEIAMEREKVNEVITAKVSAEDYQKIVDETARREALASLGIDYENFGQKPWDESMLEKVQLTEKEEKVLDIAKNLMEEHKEAFQHLAAIERKELAEKGFEELTTNEKIQLALEEIDWIVIGGQDGQEFYGSIQFLRKVLRSLVSKE